MKSIKKAAILTLSGFMLWGAYNAYAQDISVNAVADTATGAVEISGTMPVGNSDYTVMILKPGVDGAEITSENFSDKVNFIMSGKTDADGGFSLVCYPIDEWSFDNQSVMVSGAASGSTTFFYLSATLEETVVKAVSDASEADILKLISKELLIEGRALQEYLGISFSDYESLIDKSVVHKAVADGTFTTVKEISDTFLKAVAGQKAKEYADREEQEFLNILKTGTIPAADEKLRENAEKLSLDMTRAYGYDHLMKLYNEGDREPIELVFAKLRSIKGLSEVKAVFEEAVIVASINAADRQAVDEVLTEYDDEIGIDITKLSDLTESKRASLLSDMAEEKFDTLKAIEEEYNDLYSEYSKKESGGSKGSGGGGGGGGSSFSGSAALPLTTEKEPTQTTVQGFNDMESAKWAEESVSYLAAKGIISGYPDGGFKPAKAVTREEFAKMLVSALGLYSKESSCSFSDVASDKWYYKYVSSAFEAGIVSGKDEEIFGVGDSITREQAAAMIYRAAEVCGKSLKGEMEFADNDQIAEYAKEAVKAVSGTVIKGDEKGCFNPKNVTTRAQAARMIHQLMIIK